MGVMPQEANLYYQLSVRQFDSGLGQQRLSQATVTPP